MVLVSATKTTPATVSLRLLSRVIDEAAIALLGLTLLASVCVSAVWTWHDEQITPPSWRGKCFVRNDATYAYKKETHHVSGVCAAQILPNFRCLVNISSMLTFLLSMFVVLLWCQEDAVSSAGNHTLVPGGGGSSMGVRGKSVGFKMIDWVPQTTASKVRFR